MHILGLFGFILLASCIEAQDDKCPRLYLRYSDHHTFCQPDNAQCSIISSDLPPKDRGVILQEHNKYRSKLATGQEKNLSKKASNMLQMVSKVFCFFLHTLSKYSYSFLLYLYNSFQSFQM